MWFLRTSRRRLGFSRRFIAGVKCQPPRQNLPQREKTALPIRVTGVKLVVKRTAQRPPVFEFNFDDFLFAGGKHLNQLVDHDFPAVPAPGDEGCAGRLHVTAGQFGN